MRTIILILTVFALFSCDPEKIRKETAEREEVKNEVSGLKSNESIRTFTIEGHEYVVYNYHSSGYGGGGGICHSENCECKKESDGE